MSNSAVCQVCWAEGQQVGRPCWLCHNVVQATAQPPRQETPFVATAVEPMEAIPVDDPEQNPYAGPALAEDTLAYQSNGTLLMVTVVFVAVVFAAVVPGLGIPACIILLPALIRTAMTLKAKQSRGIQVTTGDRVSTFLLSALASTAAVISMGAAVLCAFFTACFVACAAGSDASETVFFAMLAFGGVFALGFGAYVFLHLTATRS